MNVWTEMNVSPLGGGLPFVVKSEDDMMWVRGTNSYCPPIGVGGQ